MRPGSATYVRFPCARHRGRRFDLTKDEDGACSMAGTVFSLDLTSIIEKTHDTMELMEYIELHDVVTRIAGYGNSLIHKLRS